MSEVATPDIQKLDELQLLLKVRSGEYSAARVGVTLVIYYAKPMRELVDIVRKLLDCYLSFIPETAIRSTLSTTGVWREFTKQSLTAGLRKLAAEGADYRSIHLSSGTPANVGEYGFHFFGSNFSRVDISPRKTCSCIMEFPVGVLDQDQKRSLEDFAAAVAEIEVFESGHGGYAFKHLSETWRDQALSWIAQRAQRYVALDISYDSFRRVARGRVVNVSWITLLGNTVVEALDGTTRIREKLSPEVIIRPLKTGLLLVAGDTPPVGDVNRGAQDIQWLKEVAALTKPVRARMEIGFGSDAFRRGWLDRLD